MKTKSKITAYIIHSIAAAVLILTAQVSLAGSATWLSSPQDSAWENANNWTPGGPPNGPSDIATFAQSSQTVVNISTSVEVNSIVFTSDSASFDFSILGCNTLPCADQLIISGTGVINNSSVSQTFAAPYGGQIIFNNASTAGSALSILNVGAEGGFQSAGQTVFNDTSNAAGASIVNGGSIYGAAGGQTIFNDTSTADHASITNEGAGASSNPGNPGQTTFNDRSTAGHATIINWGTQVTEVAARPSSLVHQLPTAQPLSLMGDITGAVGLSLMVLRRVAMLGWKFLTMVTWTLATTNRG